MAPGTPENHEQMKSLWKRFVKAIRTVLEAQPAQTLESYFQKVRDEALSLAEGEPMAEEIANRYREALRSPKFEAATIVGEELSAFEQAVQGSKSDLASGAQKGLRKRLCEAAKTIVGSLKEVLRLTDHGKAILEVLKEAIELAGGE
jgi:vacuolar-type H+-ATPase subunit E/Vma4